jgi:hypothetical protein
MLFSEKMAILKKGWENGTYRVTKEDEQEIRKNSAKRQRQLVKEIEEKEARKKVARSRAKTLKRSMSKSGTKETIVDESKVQTAPALPVREESVQKATTLTGSSIDQAVESLEAAIVAAYGIQAAVVEALGYRVTAEETEKGMVLSEAQLRSYVGNLENEYDYWCSL